MNEFYRSDYYEIFFIKPKDETNLTLDPYPYCGDEPKLININIQNKQHLALEYNTCGMRNRSFPFGDKSVEEIEEIKLIITKLWNARV